jgi:hypothetical protein
MTRHPRIAILYPGDYEARQAARADNNRFAQVFHALSELGADAEPAVYHPHFWQEVRDQLLQVDGVLVWVNPIQDGHDRTILDAMLLEVAATGVFVSAHPDIIQKMGTKEVLYRTRHLGWGCDTHLYCSLDELQQALPVRLAASGARACGGSNGPTPILLLPIYRRMTPLSECVMRSEAAWKPRYHWRRFSSSANPILRALAN